MSLPLTPLGAAKKPSRAKSSPSLPTSRAVVTYSHGRPFVGSPCHCGVKNIT